MLVMLLMCPCLISSRMSPVSRSRLLVTGTGVVVVGRGGRALDTVLLT